MLNALSLILVMNNIDKKSTFCGISCKKSLFYAKKSYFFQLRREARKFWGISCEKSRFYAKKSYFFQF
jgi:hypothetical protein